MKLKCLLVGAFAAVLALAAAGVVSFAEQPSEEIAGTAEPAERDEPADEFVPKLPELDITEPSVTVSTDCVEGCTSVIFAIPAEKVELFKEQYSRDEKTGINMQAEFNHIDWAWFHLWDPESYGFEAFEYDCSADGVYNTWCDYTENGDLVAVLFGESDFPFSGGVRASKSCRIRFYIMQRGTVIDGSLDWKAASLTDEGVIDVSLLDFGKISKRNFTGEEIKPAVTVKNGDERLTAGEDYTLSYNNNTDIGKAEVTVTGKGKYIGTKTLSFKIVPGKTALSAKPGESTDKWQYVTLNWESSAGADGYQIYYSENGGKYRKLVTVSGDRISRGVRFTHGSEVKFKIRPYAKVVQEYSRKTYYGAWSNEVCLGEEQRELPVYILENYGKEYVQVTIVPEKIYWNESEDFKPVVGEPLEVLIPAVMLDTVKSADSVILHFGAYNSLPYQKEYRFTRKSGSSDTPAYDNFLAGNSWEADYLFTIKNGVLTEIKATDEMREYFSDFDTVSAIMLDYDPDEFGYGLTVDEIDRFLDNTRRHRLETEKEAEMVREEYGDNFNVDCDYVSYSYFLEGTEMRARLA